MQIEGLARLDKSNSIMSNSFPVAVTLDTGLMIGILALITGMVPGVLGYLLEREKLKHALEQTKSQAQTVKRFEDLVTQLQNTLISIKDNDSPIVIPDSNGGDANPPSHGTTVPAPIEPPTPPLASGVQLPVEASGLYVIFISLSTSDSPKYVLLSWEAGGTRFRVRDYIGGMMHYPRGIVAPHETNFQSFETALTFDEIWRKASCHMKVRGELGHQVREFTWWNDRLETLTRGYEAGRELAPPATATTETRGVLLMLSSDQQPPPRNEVRWHAEQSAGGGTTYLATTRILTEMITDKSLVAFYADASLFNQVLGYGVFLDFIRTSTPEGRKILDEHPHYQQFGMPDQVLGLIKMRDFKELAAGTCLDIFKAKIDGSGTSKGRPLTLLNIPEGAARAQVYFKTSAQVPPA
jgi:hypothetical protein